MQHHLLVRLEPLDHLRLQVVPLSEPDGPQHELVLDDANNAPPAAEAAPPPLPPEVRSRLRRLREELVGLRAALADAAD